MPNCATRQGMGRGVHGGSGHAGNGGSSHSSRVGRGTRPLGSRLFVTDDSKIPEGYGAIAVLVLPHRPVDESEMDRYLRFCRSYLAVLPDAARARATEPERPQMVTVWPRRDPTCIIWRQIASTVAPVLDGLCITAVTNYAYESADGWVARIPAASMLEVNRGPFLIAWAPAKKFR